MEAFLLPLTNVFKINIDIPKPMNIKRCGNLSSILITYKDTHMHLKILARDKPCKTIKN